MTGICAKKTFSHDSARVEVPAVRPNAITMAALASINNHGLNTVQWMSPRAPECLTYARRSYQEVFAVVKSVDDDKLTDIVAALYDVDIHIYAAAHHAVWQQGRDVCHLLMATINRAAQRGVGIPPRTSRFFTDDSGFGYKWTSGERQYTCLWDAQEDGLKHMHFRSYSLTDSI